MRSTPLEQVEHAMFHRRGFTGNQSRHVAWFSSLSSAGAAIPECQRVLSGTAWGSHSSRRPIVLESRARGFT